MSIALFAPVKSVCANRGGRMISLRACGRERGKVMRMSVGDKRRKKPWVALSLILKHNPAIQGLSRPCVVRVELREPPDLFCRHGRWALQHEPRHFLGARWRGER